MADNIDVKFKKYRQTIIEEMTNEKSITAFQIKTLEDQFKKFGYTQEQLSEIMAKISQTSIQIMDPDADRTAISLLDIEEKRDLLAAQVKLAEAQVLLAEKDLELKEKDLVIKDKEIALKEQELALKAAELEIKEAELPLKVVELQIKQAELLLKGQEKVLIDRKAELLVQQVAESKTKEELIKKQTETEEKNVGLTMKQTELVDRQRAGYGDNLLIKAAEFQGGLASFAVNVDSNDAQNTINAFTSTINSLKSRA